MRLLKTLLRATRLVGHLGRSAGPPRSRGRWPGQAHIHGPQLNEARRNPLLEAIRRAIPRPLW